MEGQSDTLRAMTLEHTRRRALQHLIDRRFGGVQSRFGAAIGRQADYISRLVTGKKRVGERLAREIETVLGLEPGELDRPVVVSDQVEALSRPARFSGTLVPVLSWERLADSGGPHGPTEVMQALPVRVPAAIVEYTPRPASVSDTAYALVVRGPAMEPEFRDGWLIFVDEQAKPKHGDYVVAIAQGRSIPLLRQLVKEGDETYLRALSPTHPEPMLPLGNGRLLGRVVYQGKAY